MNLLIKSYSLTIILITLLATSIAKKTCIGLRSKCEKRINTVVNYTILRIDVARIFEKNTYITRIIVRETARMVFAHAEKEIKMRN